MATDAKNILIDNWDVTIIAKGKIVYDSQTPMGCVGKGIVIEEEITDLTPSGMTFKQGSANSADIYRVHIFDTSVANMQLRLSALTKIADTFTGNAQYNRIRPRVKEYVWEKSSESGRVRTQRRHIQLPVEFIRNNVSIY